MNRYPKRFDDNGTTVTVDLHGCTVRDAVYIVRRSVQEAHRRGRGSVVAIHGVSAGAASEHTIKNELERRIDHREFEQWVSGTTQDAVGGRTTLHMKLGGSRNPTPIRVNDVVRP